MLLTLKFAMGKVDPQKLGLTKKIMTMIQHRIPLLLPKVSIHPLKKNTSALVLKFDKSSNGNSRWILQGAGHLKFVKIWSGKGNGYLPKLLGCKEAMMKSYRTKNGRHDFSLLLIDKPTPEERRKYKQGVLELPSSSEWAIVEAQQLTRPALTLDAYLRKAVKKGRKNISKKGFARFLAAARELAESIQLDVHGLRPNTEDLGLLDHEGEKIPSRMAEQYDHALSDIIDRMSIYMPLRDKSHWIMTKKEKWLLRSYAELLLRNWPGKSNRLSIVHGDLNSTNAIIQHPPIQYRAVQLIDFSTRVHLGEPRWDDGRLVGDLMELYFETGSPMIRQFIETSEKITGDPKYREGLCFGIFTMTLLKLCPFGRPIKDRRVARVYLKNILRMLKKGHFSW